MAAWRADPRAPGFVARLAVTPDGQWWVGRGPPGLEPALEPGEVTHWWAWSGLALGLTLVDAHGQRGSLILFRDRVEAATWRRLRVRLRHGEAGPAP